jgi:iron complex transport system substrate-binding protein
MPDKFHPSTQRIVSLAPSVTSILYALGAESKLVGVSKWCKDVALVGSKPRVGDCWKLSVPEVMRLKPTLLIGSVPFAPATVEKILAEPVAFLALNPRSFADVDADIRTLARVVNRTHAGEKLVARMHQAFREIAREASKLRRRRKPRVYCEAWPNPRISSPPWVAELVALAGGRFVTLPGKRITDADVVRAKPDLIILAWAATGNRGNPARTLANPAFRDIPAVRNRRVVVIRDELLNTPGPPLIEGARALFTAIHTH